MNGYTFLGPDEAQAIRADRIRQLEAEHYNALLVLEEDPRNTSARKTAIEFKRRIDHHLKALNSSQHVTDEPDKPVAN